MKYITRELKGTYGYIRKQLVFEIIKTLVLYAMAFGLFLIGLLTLHTKKSLWSVFAVLALLPACKSLVGVIMLARFSSLTLEQYNKYKDAVKNVPAIYENILTTSERSFFIPVICTAGGNVIAYSDRGYDTSAIKEHIDLILKNAGHNATVKVFDDEKAFCERAAELDAKFSKEQANSENRIINTLKAVSL